MITEEQIELLVKRLIERVDKENEYFLTKIGNSIREIRELTPSQAQQLIQILKYGGNYEEIVEYIRKETNMNVQDIDNIFNAYAKKDQQFYEQFYNYKDIPFIPFDNNMALQRQTQALSNIAMNEMYNFTRANVIGYAMTGLDGRKKFYGLKETYNRVLDEAMLNVGQGKETFDMAMSHILEELGGSGLRTLEYKDTGYSIRLDSAIRMHLKGRLRELHNENQKIIGSEFGSDGIEISVHSNPAPDHAPVQGRQFSNEEYQILQDGGTATDITGKKYTLDHDGKNGYRPISEMNCYHYIFSILLGVSEPEYTEEQLKKIIDDNNKGFDLDGKHYTNYEGTQLQRQIETAIRKQKDIQTLAKASGNTELMEKSEKRIKQLRNKYKQISQVSGLAAKPRRMRTKGYNPKYTYDEKYAFNTYTGSYSYQLNEKLRNGLEVDSRDRYIVKNLDSALEKTPNYSGAIVRDMDMVNPEEFISQLKIGEEYSTKQYLSFTTNDSYNEYANIRIHINDSTKSKDLRKINTIRENETLYKRNAKFITKKIIKRNGIYHVYWKEK